MVSVWHIKEPFKKRDGDRDTLVHPVSTSHLSEVVPSAEAVLQQVGQRFLDVGLADALKRNEPLTFTYEWVTQSSHTAVMEPVWELSYDDHRYLRSKYNIGWMVSAPSMKPSGLDENGGWLLIGNYVAIYQRQDSRTLLCTCLYGNRVQRYSYICVIRFGEEDAIAPKSDTDVFRKLIRVLIQNQRDQVDTGSGLQFAPSATPGWRKEPITRRVYRVDDRGICEHFMDLYQSTNQWDPYGTRTEQEHIGSVVRTLATLIARKEEDLLEKGHSAGARLVVTQTDLPHKQYMIQNDALLGGKVLLRRITTTNNDLIVLGSSCSGPYAIVEAMMSLFVTFTNTGTGGQPTVDVWVMVSVQQNVRDVRVQNILAKLAPVLREHNASNMEQYLLRNPPPPPTERTIVETPVERIRTTIDQTNQPIVVPNGSIATSSMTSGTATLRCTSG